MISQTADGMAATGSDLGEREAVRKLLGRNPERYLRTYDRMKANGRLRMLGWCWSGLVFGATFAFYRRLYPALLAVEGTLSLMAGAGIGLAVSQGVALNHAAGAVATMHWLLGAAFYALFGRFLVVRACLVRWQRRPDSAEHLGAWSGPLLRFRLMLVLVFVGSLVLGIVLGLMATERPVGQSAARWYAREIAAPLSGMAALDVPLVMILGSSLCLLPAWLVWRWARARGVLWPCSGAVASGVAAAMAAGQLAEGLPAFAHLFPADQRLLAINYLWVAPVEEGCKLLVLAGILLPAEPDWDRRGLIAAAILMAVGFEVTETFIYLSSPYNGVAELMARVLPRHLLFAVFTAIALCWYAARQRWWKLAAAWLAATLAHASYNVAGFIVDANFMPYPQQRSDVTEQLFGIRLDSLIGGSWMELALAHLAALGIALAGAVFLLRRMVVSPQPGSAPAMAPSPGAGSG